MFEYAYITTHYFLYFIMITLLIEEKNISQSCCLEILQFNSGNSSSLEFIWAMIYVSLSPNSYEEVEFNKNSYSSSTEPKVVECSILDIHVKLHFSSFSLNTLEANIGFIPILIFFVVEVEDSKWISLQYSLSLLLAVSNYKQELDDL